MNTINIFSDIEEHIPEELFEEILTSKNIRIKRILSYGQSSPDDFWYDQDSNEWIILLKGRAGLRFEENDNLMILKPGDYLNIPAHVRHRVEFTDQNEVTIWLAIHY